MKKNPGNFCQLDNVAFHKPDDSETIATSPNPIGRGDHVILPNQTEDQII